MFHRRKKSIHEILEYAHTKNHLYLYYIAKTSIIVLHLKVNTFIFHRKQAYYFGNTNTHTCGLHISRIRRSLTGCARNPNHSRCSNAWIVAFCMCMPLCLSFLSHRLTHAWLQYTCMHRLSFLSPKTLLLLFVF